MYSRYQNNDQRSVRLPEHYSGSAFSQQQPPTAPATPPKREPARSFSKDGVGEKASPTADRFLRAERSDENIDDITANPAVSTNTTDPAVSTNATDSAFTANPTDLSLASEAESENGTEKTTSAPERSSASFPLNFAGLRRLLGGEGEGDQDRLLLLGLILLLSRSGEDSDILLWLSLLLLCG